MPLEAVHIDASLLFFNLAYALSTEREEVGIGAGLGKRVEPRNQNSFDAFFSTLNRDYSGHVPFVWNVGTYFDNVGFWKGHLPDPGDVAR
jgi:hypothetical protein